MFDGMLWNAWCACTWPKPEKRELAKEVESSVMACTSADAASTSPPSLLLIVTCRAVAAQCSKSTANRQKL